MLCQKPALTPTHICFLKKPAPEQQHGEPSPSSTSSLLSKLRTLSSKALRSDAPDLWVAITIVFSVTTYLFDYGSNLATAFEYYVLEYRNRSSEVQDLQKYGSRSEFPGIFPGIIAVIVLAHVLNALVFYLHTDSSKEALKSAYLLPIIYLKRLFILIWRTGTLQGIRGLRSSEMDALYNILAAALETGPHLILQFHVFMEIGYLSRPGTRVPRVLLLSLAASFISGAYNGGQSMAATCENPTLWGRSLMGMVGGLHIASALLLRCVAFELITEEGFYHSSTHFRYYYVYILVAVLAPCAAFWVLSKQQPSTDPEQGNSHPTSRQERLLRCVSYGYIGLTLGPLYPLVSHWKNSADKLQRRRILRLRILEGGFLHAALDVAAIVIVCGAHGGEWLTPCYAEWSTKERRQKQVVVYSQLFMSCAAFKLLLGCSLVFYVVTLLAYVLLDVYTYTEET